MTDAGQNSLSLMNSAVELAQSHRPADHQTLSLSLASEDFLFRLDSPKEYQAPPRELRLACVLRALMDNPAPSAGHVLVWLTRQAGFLQLSPRQMLLVQALAVVRPAPADAVAFWEQHSQPDSPFLTVTIIALTDNGSPPALALLESRMANPEIDPDTKISWMHRPILVHRNEAPLLESCRRILLGGMSHELRPFLVEALFDYRPEWYRSNPPIAPELAARSGQARRISREIARHALSHIPLDAAQRAAVESALGQMPGEP